MQSAVARDEDADGSHDAEDDAHGGECASDGEDAEDEDELLRGRG